MKKKSLMGWAGYGVDVVKFYRDEFQFACLYRFKKDVPFKDEEFPAYKVRITIEEI